MKEDAKMKENISNVPLGTMPPVGAMQQMQASPNISPMPNIPNMAPIPQSPMGVMPSMMHQVPMMCCPFLMNMQCPMPFGPNVMGMAGNVMPGMNAMPNVMPEMNAMPGMGVLPTTNQFYPMGGM
jgi:hypothetical protein